MRHELSLGLHTSSLLGLILGQMDPIHILTKYFNPLRTKLCLSNLKTQFVPRRKHSASVIKTDNLLLYSEKLAVCSEIHAKHINALWAEHRISDC